ncbi:ETC complex I subunit [Allosphingosinicella flava]|uniref:ETC complex I subunit n=1 Tax=Allosphingosinicella flava TaxID=2771430 RepID=A0A7T2GJ42_9SPHN|nr:ETC complex I subunit [Sphingosinicella flava]QPQ54786.1 ETC complex I subunit [Sphingosinicella flava]
MAARIFQRSKNALQSGRARAGEWVLQFESSTPRRPDPLTGWSGGADTQTQVSLTFKTLEEAKGYAEREGIAYHVVPPAQATMKIQSYADNFR